MAHLSEIYGTLLPGPHCIAGFVGTIRGRLRMKINLEPSKILGKICWVQIYSVNNFWVESRFLYGSRHLIWVESLVSIQVQ